MVARLRSYAFRVAFFDRSFAYDPALFPKPRISDQIWSPRDFSFGFAGGGGGVVSFSSAAVSW